MDLAGIQLQDGQLKAKDEILERARASVPRSSSGETVYSEVVKDVESKVIEFGTEAVTAADTPAHLQFCQTCVQPFALLGLRRTLRSMHRRMPAKRGILRTC